MAFELINPAGLERPVGYSHVAKITSGNIVLVAGQAPFDANGAVVGKGDFVAQFRQVMANLTVAVEGAGGHPKQFAALTMYITDVNPYLENKKIIGGIYREVFGSYFPVITLVVVKGLYNPDCMIEISGIAVVE